jgi:membrane-bound serine protease (ClpP class)
MFQLVRVSVVMYQPPDGKTCRISRNRASLDGIGALVDGRTMKRSSALASLLFLLGMLLPLLGMPASAEATTVQVVPVKGPIGPATSDFLVRAIEAAAADGADLVLLEIDTPGGLDTSMRTMVEAILDAPLPVIGYVAPPGARAASAGTFILYATHLAAMAPGTNLGAATPVQIGGDAGERSAHATKAMEDAAALLRSLATMRDRDPKFAESAVREAKSLTAEEALKAGVIELIAPDRAELLRRVDGRMVELKSGPALIDAADPAIVETEPDWRYQLLAIITDPNVAAILMLVGIYGIIFELYSPGLVGPGLVGAICLLLGLYALQVLPVSFAGLALLLLGIILVIAEAFVPSFGALGLGGIVAFVAGAVLLVDTDVPGFGVSPWLIGAVAIVTSGIFLLALGLALRSHRRPVVTGAEAVLAGRGTVVDWADGEGHVRLEGEIWAARGPDDLASDTPVTVEARDGLVLVVAPQPPGG